MLINTLYYDHKSKKNIKLRKILQNCNDLIARLDSSITCVVNALYVRMMCTSNQMSFLNNT